jgi:hypothetical protein
VKHLKLGRNIIFFFGIVSVLFFAGGCGQGGFSGYSNSSLHPRGISTVYVEMFDSRSFRRGHEYDLTDAVCKRIETDSPYKIVSDRNTADSVLSGVISYIVVQNLTTERNTGRIFENRATTIVQVRWQNLKTNEIMIENQAVDATAAYSSFVGQTFEYSSKVALNTAAEKIVELMQEKWREQD